MKRISLCFLFVFMVYFSAISQDKPNVIVIMADDLGYGDVGFNGSIEIPTPNIDRIAQNGVIFTNGYTTYSVCGPSRAGFMTGRYQQRFGFERNPLYRVDDPYMGLPLDEMTIAESVSQVGYRSGIIGKWHLGAHISNHPLNRGFNEFFGHLGGGHRYFPEDLTRPNSYTAKNESQSYETWIMRNHSHEKIDEYLTDEFSNEAVEFVARNKDNPFFLFLSYNAPHTPMQAKEEDLALFPDLVDENNRKRKTYAAMVHAVDRGVGTLLNQLNALNLEENTIVFFLSDNGGPETKNASDNGVLRGGKSDVYEGGYRVPFAMQWKSQITPGMIFENPVSSLDIFATLSALSESPVNPYKPLDGVNIIPFLKGEKEGKPHETIKIRKFDQDRHAFRSGDLKILYHKDRTNKKLYDLSTNISEEDSENLYWNEDFLTERNRLDSFIVAWESELKHPIFLGLVHDELVWASAINLSENNLVLNQGDTTRLKGTIEPGEAFNDVILWGSNNDSVATVDETGLITAHKDGYAVIIAKVADRQQVRSWCVVKIGNPGEATDIKLSHQSVDITVGKPLQLTATVSSNGEADYAVEWSTNNSTVATIDQNGNILTHKVGSAIITAKVVGSENISTVCTINVKAYSPPTNIINIEKEELNYSFYPNPVSDGTLTIDFDALVSDATAEIFNVNGERSRYMVLGSIRQCDMNVSGLKAGIYFLRLSAEGNSVTKKLIIEE